MGSSTHFGLIGGLGVGAAAHDYQAIAAACREPKQLIPYQIPKMRRLKSRICAFNG